MSNLHEEIDFLTSADISKLSVDEIKKSMNEIFSKIFFINFNLHPGYYVIRVRPDFEYSNYVNIRELSYKPKHLNHSYQRASVPYDTMFYCCSCERREREGEKTLFPYTDIKHGLMVSLFETVEELRENINESYNIMTGRPMDLRINKDFSKKVSYSIWVVKEKLTLARVALFKDYDFQIQDRGTINGIINSQILCTDRKSVV